MKKTRDPVAFCNELFSRAQEAGSHQALLRLTVQVFDQHYGDVEFMNAFWDKFDLNLQIILTDDHNSANGDVSRILAFLGHMFASEYEHCQVTIFRKLMVFFDKYAYCSNVVTVRHRICDIVNVALNHMPAERTILKEDWSVLLSTVTNLLKDKSAIVVQKAVRVGRKLQSPQDEKQCGIMNAFKFLMKYHPNAGVRQTVIECIVIKKAVVVCLLKRLQDKAESVQLAAFTSLSENVSVAFFSPQQMMTMINAGLIQYVSTGKSNPMLRLFVKKTLSHWLGSVKDSFIDILKKCEVYKAAHVTVLKHFTHVYFDKLSPQRLVALFADLHDAEGKFNAEKWGSNEALFMYKCVLDFVENSKNLLPTQKELLVDTLIPTNPLSFCQFAVTMANKVSVAALDESAQSEGSVMGPPRTTDNSNTNEEALFLAQTAFNILSLLDIRDVCQKEKLSTILLRTLCQSSLHIDLVTSLSEAVCKFSSSPSEARVALMNLMTEIRQPFAASQATNVSSIAPSPTSAVRNSTSSVSSYCEDDESSVDLMDLRLDLNDVQIKIDDINEEMYQAVTKKDYAQADTCKKQIDELKLREAELAEKLKPKEKQPKPKASSSMRKSASERNTTVESDADVTLKAGPNENDNSEMEICPVKDDPTTKLKCLRMLAALLNHLPYRNGLPSDIDTFFHSFVKECISDADIKIRAEAFHVVALCCRNCRVIVASQRFCLFTALRDQPHSVQKNALNAIFLAIIYHGIGSLCTNSHAHQEWMNSRRDDTEMDELTPKKLTLNPELREKEIDFILQKLLKFVYGPTVDDELQLFAVEMFSRVLLIGRVVSDVVLEKLLLLWAMPDTQVGVRALISCFLEGYVSQTIRKVPFARKMLLANSLLPCLKEIWDSSRSSKLSTADDGSLARLVIAYTRLPATGVYDVIDPHGELLRTLLTFLVETDETRDDVAKKCLLPLMKHLDIGRLLRADLKTLLTMARRLHDDFCVETSQRKHAAALVEALTTRIQQTAPSRRSQPSSQENSQLTTADEICPVGEKDVVSDDEKSAVNITVFQDEQLSASSNEDEQSNGGRVSAMLENSVIPVKKEP